MPPKYCPVRLGIWDSFCGMLDRVCVRPEKLGPSEPSEVLGRSSLREWAIFLGIWVSLIRENSWRSSGGREGKYFVTSESCVGQEHLGMEESLGREMPFSLKKALMLPKHSEF